MTSAAEERVAAPSGAVPPDTFANRLILARAHAGHLSIREAAELCGFGRGAWTNWEKGAQPIDKDYIVEVVSDKLRVDARWLRYGGPLTRPESTHRRRWSTIRPGRTNQQQPSDNLRCSTSPGQRPQPRPHPTHPNNPRKYVRPTPGRPNGHPTGHISRVAA